MRILLISDHADPLVEIGSKEAGGQNIYVFYLAKFLSKLGAEIDIYTRWDRRNKKEVVNLNGRVRVIRIKAGPKKHIPRDDFLKIINQFTNSILKKLDREKLVYDIIHSNYWFSGIAGLTISQKTGWPLVHTFHSIGQIRQRTLSKYKQINSDQIFKDRLKWEKTIAKRTRAIIATSPIEKTIIKKLFQIPASKIKFIPIGIDTNIFKPVKLKTARQKLGWPQAGKILLYVGRIEWRKGIATLLYAAKQVLKKYPRTRLYIVGGGKTKISQSLDAAEKQRLNQIAKELKINAKVKFLGPKPQRRLKLFYSAANVVVVPSYYEPFGIVPLEAMACGTPVVASKTGGLKFTVLSGSTGYLAKPHNYDDLAKKIVLILKQGRTKFSKPCRRRIEQNFLWPNIAQIYLRHFKKIIN